MVAQKSMVGMYFLTYDKDGKADMHGQIVKVAGRHTYLVNYGDWLSAKKVHPRVVTSSSLRTASFFKDVPDMVKFLKELDPSSPYVAAKK